MIIVRKGDIEKISCDAIVNPANSFGTMGGGVSLSLKEAGGSEIEKDIISKCPIPVGKAKEGVAGRLNAKYVIHAPTMESASEKIPHENVRKATRAALKCAKKLNIKKIAFPGMGTGVGNVDLETAADIMLDEINKMEHEFEEIILVCKNHKLYEIFKERV